jgi:UDP-N-acetylglucosamine 2-epimerase (non-hydrolysing)
MTVENGFQHKVLTEGYEKLILVTAHRRENFGKPIKNIFQAIRNLAEKNPGVRFVYPVHLNNNVQKPAVQILNNVPNVLLLPPLDYFTFVNILARADLVLTDSGGIQEEAPSLGIPVLVLRNETERPEAVEAGTVKIVGTAGEKIIQETLLLLNNNEAYQKMAQANNPYGDGKASQRIINCIINNILKK